LSAGKQDLQWILLAGDAMLGRGIDQIQHLSCDPALPDPRVKSARDFVRGASWRNGPIPEPVDHSYVWGEALDVIASYAPCLRILNLETTFTTAPLPAEKRVTFRAHPANIDMLRLFAPDCCTLANNHVLDWGEDGLVETLDTLRDAGLARTGVGYNEEDAWKPCILPLPDGRRVIVLSIGDRSGGVPYEWAAEGKRPGVAHTGHDIDACVERVANTISAVRQEGDVVIASIHWGENWGFDVPPRHSILGISLLEAAGVDIIHGHSSHHPKQIALRGKKLILFGCGDLINDYEGIQPYAPHRPDLVAIYLVGLAGAAIRQIRILPFRVRRMRLERPTEEEAKWLCDRVTRNSGPFGTAWIAENDGTIRIVSRERRKRLA
jgi:poly-gamma-glutamate synthesis protein (capsule biosynthesis protein)